jgi:hypothetical protein
VVEPVTEGTTRTKNKEVQYVLEYSCCCPRTIVDIAPIRNLPLILQSQLLTEVNKELNKEVVQNSIEVKIGSQIAVITLQEATV